MHRIYLGCRIYRASLPSIRLRYSCHTIFSWRISINIVESLDLYDSKEDNGPGIRDPISDLDNEKGEEKMDYLSINQKREMEDQFDYFFRALDAIRDARKCHHCLAATGPSLDSLERHLIQIIKSEQADREDEILQLMAEDEMEKSKEQPPFPISPTLASYLLSAKKPE